MMFGGSIQEAMRDPYDRLWDAERRALRAKKELKEAEELIERIRVEIEARQNNPQGICGVF